MSLLKWVLGLGAVTAVGWTTVALTEVFKPDARQSLKVGDTVQVPAQALQVRLPSPVVPGQLNEIDALRAFVANVGPNTLITINAVALLGEGSFDNSEASGQSPSLPFELAFKRDRVKVIQRGSKVLKF